MRQAIGYIRVSTQKQAADGQGMDMQRHQIEAFAKFAGYRIKQFTQDVASGMGDGAGHGDGLHRAIALAKQNQWPIIVAGFDRIARNTKRFEEILGKMGVKIISAQHGERVDPVVAKAAAIRAQHEGERISETTRKALAERKAKGMKLGNRTNLGEAQRKGAEKNRALGKQRRAEFEEMVRLSKDSGAKTVAEITTDINARGFRTARGGEWKVANVHRLLKEIGGSPSASSASGRSLKRAEPVKPEPLFDPSGYLIQSGIKRIERIMERRKMKIGDVSEELGGKRLDASLGNAMSEARRSRLNPEKAKRLLVWVRENESALGLS